MGGHVEEFGVPGGGLSDRINVLGVPFKHRRRSRNCMLAPLDVLRPGTRNIVWEWDPTCPTPCNQYLCMNVFP